MKLTRIAAALLCTALATPALAHDAECTVHLAPLTATGDYAVALPVSEYPAEFLVKATVWNTHPAASVVDRVHAPLLAAAGVSPLFTAPLTLASGETVYAYSAEPLRIDSPAACLDLALRSGSPEGAPYVDIRLVFQHARGSAECRARVVCLSPISQ